jgi:hypothetical protein
MNFLQKLFGKKGDRCTSCSALILESNFAKNNGLCALCARSPEMAAKRRSWSESYKAKVGGEPACAKCGRTESAIHRDTLAAKRKGMFVFCEDWPGLLYCDNCEKYFCGRCQIDLGMSSGCPECEKALD